MLNNIFWLLEKVRKEILESFTLPQLNISYWEFLIYLAIAGIAITVLINGVRVSGSALVHSAKERERAAKVKSKRSR